MTAASRPRSAGRRARIAAGLAVVAIVGLAASSGGAAATAHKIFAGR